MVSARHRVAVLDGGFPAWSADDLPLDCSALSEEEVAAPGLAAKNPPASPSYPAQLDVCCSPLFPLRSAAVRLGHDLVPHTSESDVVSRVDGMSTDNAHRVQPRSPLPRLSRPCPPLPDARFASSCVLSDCSWP